ncbi:18811_t:CDS:2 [Gigaspora margarita]|uniref:18811_t:CDS:1 n=1 Tax=Gigaspora margarita TaxID=4874 RepID=A0ABN7WG58_GIGMA|nr:18811_t:CDS:2 [Gigaspora margarita]
MSCSLKTHYKENQLNIQTRSEILFDGSEESLKNSIRRTEEQVDLIHFEPQEYDDGYASPTYPEYTVRATTPMPIYYEVQLNEEEESDDRMVINNPNDILVLPLHDIATDNQYENIDYQDKY